jgi:hypothetical protein
MGLNQGHQTSKNSQSVQNWQVVYSSFLSSKPTCANLRQTPHDSYKTFLWNRLNNSDTCSDYQDRYKLRVFALNNPYKLPDRTYPHERAIVGRITNVVDPTPLAGRCPGMLMLPITGQTSRPERWQK